MHVADKPLISKLDSNSSTVILVINLIICNSETLVNQLEIRGNITRLRG